MGNYYQYFITLSNIHTYMQCLYFKLNRKGGKQDEVTFIITSHSKHIYDDDDDDDEH